MHSRFIILLLILIAIDVYVFQGVRVLVHNKSESTQRTASIIYWSVAGLCFLILLLGNFIDYHQWPKPLRVYSFAMIAVIYFSKIFVVLFLLIDDLQRL